MNLPATIPSATALIERSPINTYETVSQAHSSHARPTLLEIYKKGKYLSIKHDSYFQCYEDLLKDFVGRDIIFVEIGVLNGGSLFMWREYLGANARIIGIDFNPAAVKWRDFGFEIFVGDQANPDFWLEFFGTIGDVDILLDDGGHTNVQQVRTVHHCVKHIRDGGLIIVEDVHASYMPEFGNPSKFSFLNFSKRIIDSVNSRFPEVAAVKNRYGERVYSISYFTSMVAFHIDSNKCLTTQPTTNNGISSAAADYRYSGSSQEWIARLQAFLVRKFGALRRFTVLEKLAHSILTVPKQILSRVESRKTRRLFR